MVLKQQRRNTQPISHTTATRITTVRITVIETTVIEATTQIDSTKTANAAEDLVNSHQRVTEDVTTKTTRIEIRTTATHKDLTNVQPTKTLITTLTLHATIATKEVIIHQIAPRTNKTSTIITTIAIKATTTETTATEITQTITETTTAEIVTLIAPLTT